MKSTKNSTTIATNVAFTTVAKADQSQARNLWVLGDAIAKEIAEAVENGAKGYGYPKIVIAPRLAELSGFSVGYAEKKISLARSMREKFESADIAAQVATEVKEKEAKSEPTTDDIAQNIVKLFTKNKLNARQRKAVLAKVEKLLA